MALAYPGIYAAGEALAWGFQAIAAAVPAIGLAITQPWKHHHHSSNPEAQAQPSKRRDITDTDPPGDDEEIVYQYTGQHIDASNEIGRYENERRFISRSFKTYLYRVYGNRYKFLSTVALEIARRRYKKWRAHGPYVQHTPLGRQVVRQIGEMSGFESPERPRRRKYSRAQLYAL